MSLCMFNLKLPDMLAVYFAYARFLSGNNINQNILLPNRIVQHRPTFNVAGTPIHLHFARFVSADTCTYPSDR